MHPRAVRVISRFFTEEDVYEGDIAYRDMLDEDEMVHIFADQDDYLEGKSDIFIAAELIIDQGCGECGGSWFSDPDGSTICDYATGMREQKSCHLYGWTDEEEDMIRYLVEVEHKRDYKSKSIFR